jgi:hypothetical protein
MTNLLDAFLEDVSVNLDVYTDLVRRALRDPGIDEVRLSDERAAFLGVAGMVGDSGDPGGLENVAAVVRHCVLGAMHSVMVTLDNGSMTADVGMLELVDADDGCSLIGTRTYQEAFLEHLAATKRVK